MMILIEKDSLNRVAKDVTSDQRTAIMAKSRIWDLNADGTIAAGPFGPTAPSPAPVPAVGVTNDSSASVPPAGWPRSQLAADVQASLTRADNAYNGGLLPPDDWTDPRSPAPMRARLVLAGASGDPAAAPGESGAVYAVNASASAGAAVTLSDQAVDTVLLADVSPLKPRVLPFVSPRGVMLTLGASVNTIVVSQP